MSLLRQLGISGMSGFFLHWISAMPLAQELIRVLDEDYWADGVEAFLPRLDRLEDRDGDGLDEFLVGYFLNGRVSVVSSRTGLELAAFVEDSSMGFDAEPLGDVDGDAIGDFGASSIDIGDGGIWVWSGRDSSLIHRDTYPGTTIAPVGDVNGDGLQDVAHVKDGIRVIAGGSFTELYVAFPDRPAPFFGWRIVSLGDVNGDRVPDFAASAPFDPNPAFGGQCLQAWIFVFSGKDGRQLYRIQGAQPCDYLGYGMATPGDLNGDGVFDLAASANFACMQFFDGKSGSFLGQLCNERQLEFFGRVVKAVGDINGNGYGDVLAYGGNRRELPPPFNRGGHGEAWLIDGGTRELLYRITNPRPLSEHYIPTYALAFTSCGDWNGDGQPDLAIAGPSLSQVDLRPGLIDVVSGFPLGARALAESCERVADGPRIGASGIPVLGRTYPIHLSNVPVGARGLLVVGSTPLRSFGTRLGPGRLGSRSSGLGRCSLSVQPDQMLFEVAKPAGGKLGAATAFWRIGTDTALIGSKFYAQWIVTQERRPATTTRALEITIQADYPLPYVP